MSADPNDPRAQAVARVRRALYAALECEKIPVTGWSMVATIPRESDHRDLHWLIVPQGQPVSITVDLLKAGLDYADVVDSFDEASDPVAIDSRIDTLDDWQAKVEAERKRAFDLGYTPEHDDEMGFDHLIFQAVDYARQGRNVEAAGLMVSLWHSMTRKGALG